MKKKLSNLQLFYRMFEDDLIRNFGNGEEFTTSMIIELKSNFEQTDKTYNRYCNKIRDSQRSSRRWNHKLFDWSDRILRHLKALTKKRKLVYWKKGRYYYFKVSPYSQQLKEVFDKSPISMEFINSMIYWEEYTQDEINDIDYMQDRLVVWQELWDNQD